MNPTRLLSGMALAALLTLPAQANAQSDDAAPARRVHRARQVERVDRDSEKAINQRPAQHARRNAALDDAKTEGPPRAKRAKRGKKARNDHSAETTVHRRILSKKDWESRYS